MKTNIKSRDLQNQTAIQDLVDDKQNLQDQIEMQTGELDDLRLESKKKESELLEKKNQAD